MLLIWILFGIISAIIFAKTIVNLEGSEDDFLFSSIFMCFIIISGPLFLFMNFCRFLLKTYIKYHKNDKRDVEDDFEDITTLLEE